MSNLSRLEAVSDALDTAISTANSLPDAGSGGGGSIETCTIKLRADDQLYMRTNPPFCIFNILNNGTPEVWFPSSMDEVQELIVENVICGSLFVCNVDIITEDGGLLWSGLIDRKTDNVVLASADSVTCQAPFEANSVGIVTFGRIG